MITLKNYVYLQTYRVHLPFTEDVDNELFSDKFCKEIRTLEDEGIIQLTNPIVPRLNVDGRFFCLLRLVYFYCFLHNDHHILVILSYSLGIFWANSALLICTNWKFHPPRYVFKLPNHFLLVYMFCNNRIPWVCCYLQPLFQCVYIDNYI